MNNIKNFFGIVGLCAVLSVCASDHEWHLAESQILAMLGGSQNIHVAFFSPRQGREIKELLVGLIAHEKKSVRGAVFYLTHRSIIEAFKSAVERNIYVQLIISQESSKNSAVWTIPYIQVAHVPDGLMHHKFLILDSSVANKSLLWTGSFNWTNQATKHNRENVVILDDSRLIDLYKDEFESLKQSSFSLFSETAFKTLPQIAQNFAANAHAIDKEQLRVAVQKSLEREQFTVAQPIKDALGGREESAPSPVWLLLGHGNMWLRSCVDWTEATVHGIFG